MKKVEVKKLTAEQKLAEARFRKLEIQSKLKLGKLDSKDKVSKEELEAERVRLRKQQHQTKLRS